MKLEQWRDAGWEFSHRGHDIFFHDHGDRRAASALLLIHGFPTSSWDWAPMLEALCAKFPRVIAPDMIGFGYSAKPQHYDYSIFDQADLYESLLKQLGVKRIHILAHDYGDTVAQELLARHEDRKASGDSSLVIESCVLLNGGLFPETHHARLIQKLLLTPLGPLLSRLMNRRGFGKSFSAVFGPNTQPSTQELDEFWELIRHNGGNRIMHRLIRYIPERRANRERWVGVLQKTTVPLRVINGPVDPVSGQHMVDRYRELVPNPDTVSLPGIGHYPQVEDSAGVLRAFLDFHRRIAAA
jgi:pimeloyl-ACP methyl ester carboxylesterase